jgi:hypothetical protein
MLFEMYSVEKGAATILEQWDGMNMPSRTRRFNHDTITAMPEGKHGLPGCRFKRLLEIPV